MNCLSLGSYKNKIIIYKNNYKDKIIIYKYNYKKWDKNMFTKTSYNYTLLFNYESFVSLAYNELP